MGGSTQLLSGGPIFIKRAVTIDAGDRCTGCGRLWERKPGLNHSKLGRTTAPLDRKSRRGYPLLMDVRRHHSTASASLIDKSRENTNIGIEMR